MEHRRLFFGFRSGRNVLQGKKIRKKEDGSDMFEDYWTDSGPSSMEESDLSRTRPSPSISDARFATLRQSVRKSKGSHSGAEIVDGSGSTKSPSKSLKRSIVSGDKDSNASPTKKPMLSPEHQQRVRRRSTRHLSNKSTITDDLGSRHEVKSNVSKSIRRSASNVNSIRGRTEKTAVSQNRETNEEVVNRVVAQSNVDKEERIQSRTFRHSRHSVGDQSTTSSPILRNRSEKGREASVKPKKGPRNLNVSSQNSTCDANGVGKSYGNTISPLSNKMKRTFAMQENVPDADLNNSDIRVSSKYKITYTVIDSNDGFESEMNPLSDKTFNCKDNAVGVRERVSNTSLGHRTVRKMRESLEVAKKFAKYDEYDAEIMEMIRQNEQKLRSVETRPVEKKKTKSSTSKKPIQFTEESALERGVMNANKSRKSYNFRSSNKTQTRSQSSEFGDGIIEELSTKSAISEEGNCEVGEIFAASEHYHPSQTEHDLSSNSKQKLESSSQVDKSGQLRAEQRSLRRKSSAVKSASKRKSKVMSVSSPPKHATEHQNINEDDENERSDGEKKRETSARSVPLRRSSRQRFAPLEGWRHERLLFRVEDGIINFVGIDAGIAEDDGAVRQMLRRMKKTKEAKKRTAEPKRFQLNDVLQKKKVRVPVVKRFDSTPWDKGYRKDGCPYRVKKIFEAGNFASGFLEIESNEEKPIQYLPKDDLNLTVLKGKVEATVGGNVIVGGNKDMFMIPRCIPYSIKNVGSTKALLAFTVGQFQFLESNT